MKKTLFLDHYLSAMAAQGHQPDSAQMAAARRLQVAQEALQEMAA
jgi:hypothetical protein